MGAHRNCAWLVLIRDSRGGEKRNGPEGPSDLFGSCEEGHFFFAFAGFVLAGFLAVAFLAIGYSFVAFETERSADAATPNQR
jgi:hypothetical protein